MSVTSTLLLPVAAPFLLRTKIPAFSATAAGTLASWSIFRCWAELFGNLCLGDYSSDELLDGIEFILLFFADKGISHPISLRPGGTPDAVYVIFSVIGHIVVYHQVDVVDVDAPAKDVSGYQYLETPAAELQ